MYKTDYDFLKNKTKHSAFEKDLLSAHIQFPVVQNGYMLSFETFNEYETPVMLL